MERRIKIAIEGVDFAGKSTQVKMFKNDGYPTIFEPGYTLLGDKLASILRSHVVDICPESKFLMFMADRIQTDKQVTKTFPSRFASSWYRRWFEKPVITDRSIISGIAYGYADGLDYQWMQRTANNNSEVFPDYVVIVEISKEVYLERAAAVELDALEDVDWDVIESRIHALKIACGNLDIPYLTVSGEREPKETNKVIRAGITRFLNEKK